MSDPLPPDPWQALRRWTSARIALGRAGAGLPTAAALGFALDHARARDAVHATLDVERIGAELTAAGLRHIEVHSAARDRAEYLRRPDRGRELDAASIARLDAERAAEPQAPDLVFVIADGLSALAAERHALATLQAVRALLDARARTEPAGVPLVLGPVVIARQARVALGDAIGERLGARQIVVMIGERPGLSSPDGLGLYLTHAPRVGRVDAERNCVSNVRPAGLAPDAAARTLVWLLHEARRIGATGVRLKDGSAEAALAMQATGVLPAPDAAAGS